MDFDWLAVVPPANQKPGLKICINEHLALNFLLRVPDFWQIHIHYLRYLIFIG